MTQKEKQAVLQQPAKKLRRLAAVGVAVVGLLGGAAQADIVRVVDTTRATLSALDIGKSRVGAVVVFAQPKRSADVAISGVPLTLTSIRGDNEVQGTFDENGVARFEGILPGTYSLKIEEPRVELRSVEIESRAQVASSTPEKSIASSVVAVGSGIALGALGIAVGSSTDGGPGSADVRATTGTFGEQAAVPAKAPSLGTVSAAPAAAHATVGTPPTAQAVAAPNPGNPSPAPTNITRNSDPNINNSNGPRKGKETVTETSPAPPPTSATPPLSGS